MQKYVYGYKDYKLGAYGNTFNDVLEPERMKETITRSCLMAAEEQKPQLRDQALFYFGTYDDVKGKFDLLQEPAKLLDLGDYVKFDDKSGDLNESKEN